MGTEISAQAGAFAEAVFLGMGFSMLYDALRAIRLKRRRKRTLTTLLDALYCLALAIFSFPFALRIGGGELRFYMLAAAAAGGMLSFLFLSPLLRPLWDFWADILFDFLQLLYFPIAAAKNFYKKTSKFLKRLFLFSRNSLIIESYKYTARRAWRQSEKKEGLKYAKENRPQKKSFQRSVRARSAASHRHTRINPAREDRRSQDGKGRSE